MNFQEPGISLLETEYYFAQSVQNQELAWDGWVSLSGNTYGPTRDNNKISGYAWGDDVVGWIAFDNNLDQVTIEEATAQCGPV
ncbi:hypothetical protein GW764_03720, partial [Candidatus Parcubacteria bacterium]|nr:hypothetical protein [Candidatus Parcubacteria bacterium]